MIFAHAPIIFPAVTGSPMTFLRIFYVHLFLLHGSLLVRVIGDLGGVYELRYWGGMFNAIAIGLFLVSSVIGILSGE